MVPGSPRIMAPDGMPVVPGVDGLVTVEPGVVLAIYIADCGPIWLADRKTGAIGLLHSGKKGTEGNIFEKALAVMAEKFGTRPEDVISVLGPCIRPPHYEVDFAGEIGRQAERAGVGNFLDCGLDTAADLERFYSYRLESGKTGRMMALITRDCHFMNSFTLNAPAKLNCRLRVLGKRDDGFHEIDTLDGETARAGGSAGFPRSR